MSEREFAAFRIVYKQYIEYRSGASTKNTLFRVVLS